MKDFYRQKGMGTTQLHLANKKIGAMADHLAESGRAECRRHFRWSRIPRCPGIRKLEIWEEETRKWTDGSACLQSPTNI